MADAPPSPPLDAKTSVEGLLELARARAKAGDAEGAGRTFAAALHLAEAHNLWGPTARAQAWLAGIDVRKGRLPLARARLDRARSICMEQAVEAAVQAEVAAQLGQVLLFQGQAGPGVALMAEALGRYRELGQNTECDELELALAAVRTRVEQAVSDAREGTPEQVHARVRRAEVALGLGSRSAAREDLGLAWSAAGLLTDRARAQVGLQYARLLATDEESHHAAALTVLQTIRGSLPLPQQAEADALAAGLLPSAPAS